MAASLMDSAEVFFERFQQVIEQLASGFPNLMRLFDWADRKARRTTNPDIVAGRLYYLSLGLIFDNDRSMSRTRARACQAALAETEKFLGLSQSSNLFRNQLMAFPLGLNERRANNEALELELDRVYDLALELEIDSVGDNENLPRIDLDLSRLSFISILFARSVSEAPRRVLSGGFAAYNRKLRDRYHLNVPLPLEEFWNEIDLADTRLAPQHKWLTFDQHLRSYLEESNDIGYEWGLGGRDVETLTNIVRATGLMSECLNVAAIADRATISRHLLLLSRSSELDDGLLISA